MSLFGPRCLNRKTSNLLLLIFVLTVTVGCSGSLGGLSNCLEREELVSPSVGFGSSYSEGALNGLCSHSYILRVPPESFFSVVVISENANDLALEVNGPGVWEVGQAGRQWSFTWSAERWPPYRTEVRLRVTNMRNDVSRYRIAIDIAAR